jgi:hypothetical protein
LPVCLGDPVVGRGRGNPISLPALSTALAPSIAVLWPRRPQGKALFSY